MGTLKSSCPFLLILGFILGVSWDPLWRQFCDLSVIWGTKVGGSFQVHLFDDPGMEMMPECSGCMCLNHSKNCGFREIPRFPLIHEFDVPRGGFRWHFGVCWWPWGHFFSFVRVFGRGLKFDDFLGVPLGGPKQKGTEKWKVKKGILGPRTPTKSRLPIQLP